MEKDLNKNFYSTHGLDDQVVLLYGDQQLKGTIDGVKFSKPGSVSYDVAIESEYPNGLKVTHIIPDVQASFVSSMEQDAPQG